eukprot:CAMPEP_0177330220 /NCGR_PEP_ID=MMETSP0368-20130122/20403_1 /TAXON_ID=447022 ORGANISM="Scrippsiella hangoei-like, Strain SHHI-4" /NCGR_SAMPLE_ID=MMETSP0368 /ASSEMBLY_ACC=CAM_ASM_000363 /LENGTH=41 /DNA_ID= /DNA_START= /DNA_END= /DNA_ORIENTATION=
MAASVAPIKGPTHMIQRSLMPSAGPHFLAELMIAGPKERAG